jgi:parallel beta-helix repeat protein
VHIFGAVKNGYGFSISGSDNVWISNCIVENVTTGILIDSDNVWVSNCFIEKTTNGISQYNNYENAHIYDNIIKNCSAKGIELQGINNIVEGNIINGTGSAGGYAISAGNFYNTISNNIIENFVGDVGIYLFAAANFSVVENNIIRFFKKIGIRVYGCYNVIAGNIIANSTVTDAYAACIEIRNKGSYNTIDANGCYYCQVPETPDTGIYGYGIRITTSDCNNNTVVGNTSLFNEDNIKNYGTGTYMSGNNFI